MMECSISSQDSSLTLYFILPLNYKPEECSKIFKYGYQACREHGLGPIWLSSEECLQKNPTKKDVFVCDSFEGEAYHFLLSGNFKCVILGPRCLLTCLHSKKPIPELRSPLHNMAMHEIVVTSTGYEKEEKSYFAEMVAKMCGIFSNNYHEGITHLIAKTVLSKKYLVAVEKEIPIMTEEWVKAVWNACNGESDDHVSATEEKFIKYTCPIFRGLIICVSQLPRSEKDALKDLIEENGGTYSPFMEMAATSLLITSSSEGEKYSYATKWRIPCVSQDWIQDSVESGCALPWEKYKVINSKKASTPIKDQSVQGPPDVSICSTIAHENSGNLSHRINDTTEADVSSFSFKNTVGSKAIAGLSALENLDPQEIMKAGQFLDGCKIFISGIDLTENEKLRRILNVGGATRFNNLSDAVTHIVVGKHIEEHLTAIESWNAKPHVVTVDWLAECAKQGKLVDEDNFSYLNNEPLVPEASKNPSAMKTSSISHPTKLNKSDKMLIDEDLVSQYIGNAKTSNVGNLEKSLSANSHHSSQSSTWRGGIFKDMVFTISGYGSEVEEEVKELICENGGEVANTHTHLTVNYCVVSPDGEGVFHPNALNYVTHNFLEDCIEKDALLPVEYFHMPLLWSPGSSILDSCAITLTMYSGKERRFLTDATNKLGALYQDVFAKKDNVKKGVKCSTHLLCHLPEGRKFEVAQTWGVPAVTKDWLLECISKGCRVPEESFLVDQNPKTVNCKDVISSLIKAHYPSSSKPSKGIKRTMDSLSEIRSSPKRPFLSPSTGKGNMNHFSSNPAKSSPSNIEELFKKDEGSTSRTKPANCRGPLTGVVVYSSRKLLESQQDMYRVVSELGGDYRWTYDSSVTHFLYYGRANDLNKEFRIAKDQGKFIVAPDWVWNCKEEGKRVDESSFPHVHNPKLSLSLISTKIPSSGTRKKCNGGNLITDSVSPQGDSTPENSKDKCVGMIECEGEVSEKEVEVKKSTSLRNEELAKQLEELDSLASAIGVRKMPNPNTVKSKSLPVEKIFTSSTRSLSSQHKNGGNTETESQSTAITWDDPQEREARARLEVALVGDTEEILMNQENLNNDNDAKMNSSSSRQSLQKPHSSKTSTYVFALSGIVKDKEYYVQTIYDLGGKVIDSKQFDSSVTHVVATKLSRSEKFLGAIAQGKWILYMSFLEASKDAGRFVDEPKHEWGNPKAVILPTSLTETERKLASAAHRLRLKHNETGKGVFHPIKAIIFSSRERVSAFTRLIEAGGGQVVQDYDDEITHCFVEIHKTPDIDLMWFARRGIPCLHPLHLNEILLDCPPPDEKENYIQEYKEILMRLR